MTTTVPDASDSLSPDGPSPARPRVCAVVVTADATHWLLPIDPVAHAAHLPRDWRIRLDATAVWEGIGRTQPIDRWCLRSGFRAMRAGDVMWAYLSRRQEVCAVGRVEAIEERSETGQTPPVRFVRVTWDPEATAALLRTPLSRRVFGQVPMSTCRARPEVAAHLVTHLEALRPFPTP